MDKLGVKETDRIRLAGAFGSHISTEHAMLIGLLPDCDVGNVSSAGNSAGTGARIALLSVKSRVEIEEVVRRIEKIETAIEPKFQDHFVAANAIPHKNDPFPELTKVVNLPKVHFNLSSENKMRRRRRRS